MSRMQNAKKKRFFCFGVYVRVCQILQYDDAERWIFSSLSSGTYRATYKLRKIQEKNQKAKFNQFLKQSWYFHDKAFTATQTRILYTGQTA